jgi:hypothetical protein
MGDINNDGYDDFSISTPMADANGLTSNGKVSLFLGRPLA